MDQKEQYWDDYFNKISESREHDIRKRSIDLLDNYLLEVGRLSNNWNMLHEHLRMLFCIFLRPSERESNVASQVWYAIESDRAQRKMLLRAAEQAFRSNAPPVSWMGFGHSVVLGTRFPKGMSEIQWLIKEIDGDLAEKRNNIIHSPMTARVNSVVSKDGSPKENRISVGPFVFGNSPRANKLEGEDFDSGEKLLSNILEVSHRSFLLAHYAGTKKCSLDESKFCTGTVIT
jgi:hypothetical protein